MSDADTELAAAVRAMDRALARYPVAIPWAPVKAAAKALAEEHAEALRLLQWLFRTGDPGVKGEPRWNARAAAFELLDRVRREDPSSSWPAPE